jgi:hypothetical protein
MWIKAWLLEGTLAAIVALCATYLFVRPAPSVFAYGALLGWSGMIGVLIVMLQGFRKAETRGSGDSGTGIRRYDFAINRWGGIHTALSIAITVLLGIHGLLFYGGLSELSLPLWLGASAFFLLIALNLSGLLTESKRKLREFSSLRTIHVVLMLIVVALSIIHIQLLVGPSYARIIMEGAIVAGAVAIIVLLSVPMTIRTNPP